MTASQPTRTYLVVMPLAEARHLAGTGPGRPTTPEHHLAAAIREWLAGLSRRRATIIAVRKVITDLSLLLETSPLPRRPLRGPFGPARHGPRSLAGLNTWEVASSAWTRPRSAPWPPCPAAKTSK